MFAQLTVPTDSHFTGQINAQVNPATWTVLEQDGPNHLVLRFDGHP